jgi:hypothetical protein
LANLLHCPVSLLFQNHAATEVRNEKLLFPGWLLLLNILSAEQKNLASFLQVRFFVISQSKFAAKPDKRKPFAETGVMITPALSLKYS